MPFRLRVKNFQSIEDASLDVDGLTVVTGPNNSGKTAMIRAVYGAFTNARGTKYVRHGKESCEVALDFADGRSLVWEKGEKVNRYVLDGKTLNKVGQGAPPEMISLGVQPVEASGRELWPQFAHQFVGQVFLIDEPGSVLAEAISDVTRVGVLNEALRNAQSDRRTAAGDLKLRQSDVAKHEAATKKFDGLDDALKLATEVDSARADLTTLQRQLDEARRFRDRLRQAQAEVSRLSPVRDHGAVDDAPLAKATKAESALGWVRTAAKRWAQVQEAHDAAQRAVGAARQVQLPDWEMGTLTKWVEATDLSRKTAIYLQSVQSLRRESGDAEKLVFASTGDLSTLLVEAGVCPTCGSETHDEADHA